LTYSNGGGEGSREHNLIYERVRHGTGRGKVTPSDADNIWVTYHDSFTNFLILNSFSDATEVLIESSLKTNHKLYASFVTGINGFDSLAEISGNWFLAENVLSVGSSGFNLLCVELRRRADPNGIDFWVGDDIHCIIGESGHVELLGG
jgi:hypothetical protein